MGVSHHIPTEEKKHSKHAHNARVGCCAKYFFRLDEAILKPLFIYKYRPLKAKRQTTFYNAFVEEGELAEAAFKKAKTRIHATQRYEPKINS